MSSSRCRRPPRCACRSARARRQVPGLSGPVDRSRHRHGLQQVPEQHLLTSIRRIAPCAFSPASSSIRSITRLGRSRPTVWAGGRDRRAGRTSGGMIGNNSAGGSLHRLRQNDRSRPPSRRRPRRRPAQRVRPVAEGVEDACRRRRRRTLPFIVASSTSCGNSQRRDSPPLPAYSAPRQRLQPRRPVRRTPALRSPSAVAGLHQLIVGSEGTLAVITEAELKVIPRPKARGLLVPQFATLAAALDALAPCLELQPSAVELMDQMLLELAADNLSLRDTMKAIHGNPKALLMVEFSGDDEAEVADRVEKSTAAPGRRQRPDSVGPRSGPGHTRSALEPAPRRHAAPVWHDRRSQAGHVHRGRGRLARSVCRSSPPDSAKSSIARAPMAPSTAMPASAVCTFGRSST